MQVECPHCGYVFYQNCSSGICICPNCIRMIEASEKKRSEEEIRKKLEFLRNTHNKFKDEYEVCLNCEEAVSIYWQIGLYGDKRHDGHIILLEKFDCEQVNNWIEALKWVLGEDKKNE